MMITTTIISISERPERSPRRVGRLSYVVGMPPPQGRGMPREKACKSNAFRSAPPTRNSAMFFRLANFAYSAPSLRPVADASRHRDGERGTRAVRRGPDRPVVVGREDAARVEDERVGV